MSDSLDDLISSTLDSFEDTERKKVVAPKVVDSSQDPLQKLLESVGQGSGAGDELCDVLKGLDLGNLLDGIEDSDIDDLISKAEELLGGEDSGSKDKLADLLAQVGSSDMSDDDKAILKEIHNMVSDLDAGKSDEASVAARAFDLVNKLKSSD